MFIALVADSCGGINEVDRVGNVGRNDSRKYDDVEEQEGGKSTLLLTPSPPFCVPYDDRIPPPSNRRMSASVSDAGRGG